MPNLQPACLVLLVSLTFSGISQGQEAAIPESERQALIAFFESTDGPNWIQKSNWLGPVGSEAQWFGVTIEDGHVTRLVLWANGVDGTLPPEIGELGELRELSFCSNPCNCIERPALPATGSVQARCTPAANPDLAALFLVGNLERLDGTSAIVEQSRRLFFNEILDGERAWQGGPARTLLQLINPNHESVEVQLQFNPEESQSLNGPLIADVEIPPQGFFSQSAGELFNADLSGISGRVEVEVAEGLGVIGFELLEIGSGAAFAGLPAIGQASSNSLCAAQVVSGAGFVTRLTLGRLQSRHSLAFVSLIQDGSQDGSLLPPVRKSVRLDVVRSLDIGELFELDRQVLTAASLFVETAAPFIGNVIIGQGTPTRSAVAFPLQQQAFREAVFGQIASSPEVYSGFALFNPGPEAAQLTLQAFSSAGLLLGQKGLRLEPGQRTSQLLRELLPEQGQLGGFLRLRASSPIVAAQVIGDFRGQFMSAVPPLVIDQGN